MLVICPFSQVWAASIGTKYRQRVNGAKLAITAMLALKAAEAGTLPELSTFAFNEFLVAASSAAL